MLDCHVPLLPEDSVPLLLNERVLLTYCRELVKKRQHSIIEHTDRLPLLEGMDRNSPPPLHTGGTQSSQVIAIDHLASYRNKGQESLL